MTDHGGQRPENNQMFLQLVEWRFTQIMQGMHHQTEVIHKTIDSKLSSLNHNLTKISGDVEDLKQIVNDGREEILELQEDRDIIFDRIKSMEELLDHTEQETKRKNIKIFGVDESFSQDRTSIDLVVDVLNHYSSVCDWARGDIDRAYRLGEPRDSREPRPIVAQFQRFDDKMMVLGDRGMRDDMRKDSIRIASDLTTKQRSMLAFYRDQGKTAFFVKGKIQIRNQNSTNREKRRNYVNEGTKRKRENRPQQSTDNERTYDERIRQSFDLQGGDIEENWTRTRGRHIVTESANSREQRERNRQQADNRQSDYRKPEFHSNPNRHPVNNRPLRQQEKGLSTRTKYSSQPPFDHYHTHFPQTDFRFSKGPPIVPGEQAYNTVVKHGNLQASYDRRRERALTFENRQSDSHGRITAGDQEDEGYIDKESSPGPGHHPEESADEETYPLKLGREAENEKNTVI